MELFQEQRAVYTSQYTELQDSGSVDERLQRSYHMIALGLRKEDRLKDLAAFIVENGRFMDTSNLVVV